MVRPVGFEPTTAGLEVFGSEATRGSRSPLRPHLAAPDQRQRPLAAARGNFGLSVNCQSSSAALLAHFHERVRQADLDERLPRDAEPARLLVDLTQQVDREVHVHALDVPAGAGAFAQVHVR